jgi:iron complex transport system substrate-binding protein
VARWSLIAAEAVPRGAWRARVTKRAHALALVAMLCAAAPARGGDAAAVVDDWGRVVRWERAPQRIVSLAPHATELLFAAGAGERVVAVDAHSDRPQAARRLARVSSYPAPDREALLALRPDLVVLWGAAADREQVGRLEALGLAVFVSEPRTLEAIAGTLERFGRLGGDPAQGARAAERLRERVGSLRARYQRGATVPVFVQAWSRPLITLSDRDTIGDALRICGARNLFADLPVAAPQVGIEAVLAASPRLIVSIEPRADRSIWDGLGMLAPRGSIEFAAVDASIQRPTERIVPAIEALCEAVDRVRRH